jgi:cytochrome P450
MLMYVLFNVTTYPGSYGMWALVDVLSHPDVLALARARSGTGRRRAFLEDCLNETIRLHPVGLLARGLAKPLLYESAGRRYFVPAGHVVAALPYAINRNEAEYHDAERYAPQSRQGERPAALFGRGAFGCVAASFTRTLIGGMLDRLLTEFDLDLCDPVPARLCRVALPYPSRPLRVVARLRAGSSG